MTITVGSGQVVSDITVSSGVELNVISGGIVSNVVLSGGSIADLFGGSAVGTTILAGDMMVYSGGTTTGTTIQNGTIEVEASGTISNTTVSGGFVSILSGGTAIGTVVDGGVELVNGGVDSNATINASLGLTVTNGGSVTGATLAPGVGLGLQNGTVTKAVLDSGANLPVDLATKLIDPALALNASVDIDNLPYVAGGSATLNSATDLLTISEGGSVTPLQLAGSYAGESFALAEGNSGAPSTQISVVSATPPASIGSTPASSGATPPPTSSGGSTSRASGVTQITTGSSGGSVTVGSGAVTVNSGTATISSGGVVTSVGPVSPTAGTVQIPTGGGFSLPATTSTPIQTAFALSIITAAGLPGVGETFYNPLRMPAAEAITLATPVLIDLPASLDAITGTAAVPLVRVLLDNPNATYVTGGTAASTVVATDGTPVTIVNNNPGGALIAVTGAADGTAGNLLEGLSGANQFITGSGGRDAVLLNGVVNNLTTNGADAVLVGGPSTIDATASGLDTVAMTAGTSLGFINQSTTPAADSIAGAANATVLLVGGGNTSITAGAGSESFFVDTAAGNVTLNGNPGGADAFTFIKDAPVASAQALVTNFTAADVVAVHGYAGFNVQASAATPGAAMLALSDGSQVTFTNVSVAALQQAVRVV